MADWARNDIQANTALLYVEACAMCVCSGHSLMKIYRLRDMDRLLAINEKRRRASISSANNLDTHLLSPFCNTLCC